MIEERLYLPKWLLCPTKDELRELLRILDIHESSIRAEQQYLDKLKLEKKGLMHDLLTGKVRVKL
nr:hypothetical protein [Desulfobacterales bacterium]